jgi:hypothetical protein
MAGSHQHPRLDALRPQLVIEVSVLSGAECLLSSELGEVNARYGSLLLGASRRQSGTSSSSRRSRLLVSTRILNLITTISGLSTMGIVLLEVVTAVAVIACFRTRPERHALAAPLIGLPGLGIAIVVVVKNVLTVSGAHSTLVNALPCVVMAAASRSGRTRCACEPADRIATRRLLASRTRPLGSG